MSSSSMRARSGLNGGSTCFCSSRSQSTPVPVPEAAAIKEELRLDNEVYLNLTFEERVRLDVFGAVRSGAQTRFVVHVQQASDEGLGSGGHEGGEGDLLEEDRVLGGVAVLPDPVVHRGGHLDEGVEVVVSEGSVASEQLEHRHTQGPPVHGAAVSSLLITRLAQHDHHLRSHVSAVQAQQKRGGKTKQIYKHTVSVNFSLTQKCP